MIDVVFVPSNQNARKLKCKLLVYHMEISSKTFCNLLVGPSPMFGYNCSGFGTPQVLDFIQKLRPHLF